MLQLQHFRLITGQERPTYGELLVAGSPVGFPGPDRGTVDQKYSLQKDKTVLQNVMLGRRLEKGLVRYGLKWRAYRDEAVEMLKRMRINESDFNKYDYELSGGMMQRVAIAQALMKKPKIFLMDEPFGALDENTRNEMQVLILELWQEYGMTILFVTHTLTEALYLGSRIFVLSQHHPTGNTQGAKIVYDTRLPTAQNMRIKESLEFVKLREQIEGEFFNPESVKAVHDFNVTHPDAFSNGIPDGIFESSTTNKHNQDKRQ
ncbi:MAG: NitT/TauT family transport system ATP-binding protein [Parcubacteria group bacterium Gr01-1014_48]|nr:MAG: NitT/TauT family transport system ATP-binding protein [Parcubacteria group bacterium Greene0416_14]TSC72803.1 MAG: NitT/TauT family transport system ATP-binding protein [Parcubacteria group bacterium Gr01-1014_48]TSD00909.1 MAG: NitT/TauT family transport system ATP-binding protein [Parcubacteria group bacterium Greene1014_15]TSD07991.1 MAG: NitT/TauT family transport system ATP-binding protein [Parcubacteria group bacterium Greene0714_4]